MGKKKDPFDFDDPVEVKKEWTRDEIRAFEHLELQPFLCKVGDADYTIHLQYLHLLVNDALKSVLTSKRPSLLASTQTKEAIIAMLKDMPKYETPKPPQIQDDAKDDEREAKMDTYEKKLTKAKAAYKTKLTEFRASLKDKIEELAKQNVVGELCADGRNRFLKSKGVIGFYRDGSMFIIKDMAREYTQLQAKLRAYDDLVGKRHYAKQQELAEMSKGVAASMSMDYD